MPSWTALPLRRGGRADLPMPRYVKKSAWAGAKRKRDRAQPSREVKPILQPASVLPGCADSKIAWHLFYRGSVPSSKEGIRPFEISCPDTLSSVGKFIF